MTKYKLILVYADMVLAETEMVTVGQLNNDLLKCRAIIVDAEKKAK